MRYPLPPGQATEEGEEVSELKKLTYDLVYSAMVAATEVARLHCQDDPDLLPTIGSAIWARICEGDVYNDILKVMIQADPKFFADMLQEVLNEDKEDLYQ